MAFNRIQFQPGMSIPEFLGNFGTEAQCAEAIKSARWPDGFRCPRCGAAEHCVVGHGERKLFQCNGCRHQTSLTAGSLRAVLAGPQAPTRCELPHGLAVAAKDQPCNGPAGPHAPPGRGGAA